MIRMLVSVMQGICKVVEQEMSGVISVLQRELS